MKQKLFRTYLISAVFVCIISFPFLNDRLHFIKDIPNLENRKLAKKPILDITLLDPYPAAFEKYYNDTFALRSRLVSYFNIYNCVLLQKSPFPDKIIIGKNGWLYLGGANIDSYLGKGRFTENELLALKNIFEGRQKYLASKNCKLYVMITPGKANIYPENIPFTFYRANPQGWGEQLTEFMNANTTVTMIDLFKDFSRLKSKELLYYKLENHWNHLGAFEAANIAIAKMSKDFPVLKPLPVADYKIVESPREIGNMKQMLGNLDIYMDVDFEVIPRNGFKAIEAPRQNYPVPNYFPYPWEYEHEKEIKNSQAPRMLIFSDSFGGHIFPYFCEHFSRTVNIFGGWNYVMNKEIVEKEKPDIVLLMIQEPLIRNLFIPIKKK